MLQRTSGAWKGDGAEELRFLRKGFQVGAGAAQPRLAPGCCRGALGVRGSAAAAARRGRSRTEGAKGQRGQDRGGMAEVVAAAPAFPACDRAGVARLCETGFAGLGVARQKPLAGLGS